MNGARSCGLTIIQRLLDSISESSLGQLGLPKTGLIMNLPNAIDRLPKSLRRQHKPGPPFE
jgi:hypothetical protein